MLFVCFLIDNPNKANIRREFLEIHRSYLKSHKDIIYFAGPLENEKQTENVGSLYVVEQPTRATADAWLANEPFAKNDLFITKHVFGWHHLKGARKLYRRLYLYFQLDGKQSHNKRSRFREEHVDYLLAHENHLFAAGPLFNDSDKINFEDRIGSLFVVDFSTRALADHWREQEPYTKNNVYNQTWGYAFNNLWLGAEKSVQRSL